jgi:hypothetical protein
MHIHKIAIMNEHFRYFITVYFKKIPGEVPVFSLFFNIKPLGDASSGVNQSEREVTYV